MITISCGEESLVLPIHAETAAALLAQLRIQTATGDPLAVGELVGWRLVLMLKALAGTGPSGSLRPTEPQIKYACDLALKYGIPLPPEVLRSRVAIGTFISGLTFGAGPARPGPSKAQTEWGVRREGPKD